ncbi:hypothetical protein KOR42_47990 [Thalassoglobus neptunius]|uniref:Uncharacterized protein n=1 Tax=Thalassoglobus neptunius TaxID=1938619 RepID=A0A5C5VS33_9PLAN|nr:hypothetical protein [Thalassoglobus neptunius]TWT41446.1 hypothetical protein KOR42_47990 [Thalassoglobus neptunius]
MSGVSIEDENGEEYTIANHRIHAIRHSDARKEGRPLAIVELITGEVIRTRNRYDFLSSAFMTHSVGATVEHLNSAM